MATKLSDYPVHVQERLREQMQRDDGRSPLPAIVQPGKRIRQDDKPLMNKLETDWHNVIKDQYPNYPEIRIQAVRFRLSRSSWYKPDFFASLYPAPDNTGGPAKATAWECKGPHVFRGGLENLKMAATAYPEIRWLLVWKETGQWKQQEILP